VGDGATSPAFLTASTPLPVSQRPPRLAVSGASGTGKSTLARALAQRLEVPYLEEGMRRRLEAGLDLHTLSHHEHRALTESLLEEMLAAADRAVAHHGGFVCDRCPLDMAAFWLYYRFAMDEQATSRFMQRADRALGIFDAVVLLPREALVLEDDGVRSANPWIQLHFDALLQAMVNRAGDSVMVLRLPADCVALDVRVHTVMTSLGR
jgi:predicted ATPase